MKLYVPELGDKIKLTADWSFKLWYESRNITLWDSLNCDSFAVKPDPEPLLKCKAEAKQIDSTAKWVNMVDQFGFSGYSEKVFQSDADKKRFSELSWEIYYLEQRQTYAEVTLKVGLILKVDRIYIRKGAADYSSMSFIIESGLELPEEKKTNYRKKYRVWAKLADCNTIEFERA